jgi:hypothetical protein
MCHIFSQILAAHYTSFMKSTFITSLLVLFLLAIHVTTYGQKIQDGKLWLNDDGSNYFKVTLISQVWIRNTDMNPGTTIN